MDDLAILLFFLLLGALGWFWADSMLALEAARKYGRKACEELGLQFLDDAVARTRLRVVRNHNGRRVFRRTYHFEFTETGNSRLEGELILLGHRLEEVTMEPYQIMEQPNLLDD
jgi:hypothetical protein